MPSTPTKPRKPPVSRPCEDCGRPTHAKASRRCTRCQIEARRVRQAKRRAEQRAKAAERLGTTYVCGVCLATHLGRNQRTICPACARGVAVTHPEHPAFRPNPPEEPTDTQPGSEARMAVYAQRAAAGQGLFCPRDCKGDLR